GGQQAIHHLVLDLGLDCLAQFTLHVLANFVAERFQTTFLHTEQSKEFVVQLRQQRCGNAVHGHGELSGFTSQVEVLIILGENRVDHAFFTGLDANQRFFEAGDHATGTQHQRSALGGATSKGFAVDLADEIDVQLIAILGGTLNILETGVLLAQHVEHGVDIGIDHFSLQTLDGNVLKAGPLDLREHFEGRNVFQVFALLEHFRLDGRSACGVQLLLNHGFVEGFLNQVAQGFLTSGCVVALTDHAHRHLAGTKTGDLGTTGSLLQTFVDFVLDALGRYADGHAALQSGGAFNRNLHVFSSLHRHKPAFRPQNGHAF